MVGPKQAVEDLAIILKPWAEGFAPRAIYAVIYILDIGALTEI
jgi:hypothetical protein